MKLILKCRLKVAVLAWRLFQNMILTKVNLFREKYKMMHKQNALMGVV